MKKLALNAVAGVMAAFLLLPVLAIVPTAFGARSYLQLPPADWSLRWWYTFFNDASWRQSLATSLLLAGLTVLLSLGIGLPAALGIARLPGRWRGVAIALVMGPAVVPAIVLAVALYAVARGSGLVGTLFGLALAHSMLALPYAVMNIRVSLQALDPRLLLAASGLGAPAWRIFSTVTLPLILPGVAGAAAFAFVTSFDEVVLSIFLAGPQVKTLPVRMWEEIRVELTPVIAVAATVMIALSLVVGALSQARRRRVA